MKEEHQSLTTALTLYPPTSTPGSTPSSSVININDVGQLSSELHVPHLSEHDAVSVRATVSVGNEHLLRNEGKQGLKLVIRY